MRLVVVKYGDGVSAIPMWRPIEYYEAKYKVVAVVNKPHNFYYVSRIKEYFRKRGM